MIWYFRIAFLPLYQNESLNEIIHMEICSTYFYIFSFKSNSFSYEMFFTQIRFQTEIQGNLGLAFSVRSVILAFHFSENMIQT